VNTFTSIHSNDKNNRVGDKRKKLGASFARNLKSQRRGFLKCIGAWVIFKARRTLRLAAEQRRRLHRGIRSLLRSESQVVTSRICVTAMHEARGADHFPKTDSSATPSTKGRAAESQAAAKLVFGVKFGYRYIVKSVSLREVDSV
jgi:hypothetical protein